jgi:hypothetical protein
MSLRRIEARCTVVLGKRADLLVPRLLAHLRVDPLANLPPAVCGPLAAVALHELDASVEGDPGHHLGVREVAIRSANLPHSRVGLVPVLLEPPEQDDDERPRLVRAPQAVLPRLVERVDHLAVDVELPLL